MVKEKSKAELQEYLQNRDKKQNEAAKENWDRVSVSFPKGTKDQIKAKGETVNGLINKLVLEWLENN